MKSTFEILVDVVKIGEEAARQFLRRPECAVRGHREFLAYGVPTCERCGRALR